MTHSISFLPQVDQIVVISDGQITEQGTYQQLLSHKGPFSEILQMYGTEAEDVDDTNDIDSKSHLQPVDLCLSLDVLQYQCRCVCHFMPLLFVSCLLVVS